MTSRRIGRPEAERFEDHFVRRDGCWEWQGSHKAQGYGQFFVKRDGGWKAVIAHRYAYELWVGPIPDRLEIDHLCSNPPCVNPAHLEPVTRQENIRRASERIAARPFCSKGHEIAVLGRTKAGKCKACVRERNKRYTGDATPHGERTHCPAGHPYSGDNLRIARTSRGGEARRCRTCDNLRSKAAYEKRKLRAG